jgi:hypothetical protein
MPRVLKSTGFLAMALYLIWVLLLPGNSFPDATIHLARIFCGNNLKGTVCQDSGEKKTTIIASISSPLIDPCKARTKIVTTKCELKPEFSREDISTIGKIKALRAPWNVDYTSDIYYGFMHLFICSSKIMSIFILKLINLVIFGYLIFATLRISNRKYEKVILTMMVLGLGPIGLWLMTSLNPISWQLIGVIPTIIFAHEILHNNEIVKISKIIKCYVPFLVSSFLIIVSRRDGMLVFAVSVIVGIFFLGERRWKGGSEFPKKFTKFTNTFKYICLAILPLCSLIFFYMKYIDHYLKLSPDVENKGNFFSIHNVWGLISRHADYQFGFFGTDVNQEKVSYLVNYRISLNPFFSLFGIISVLVFVWSLYRAKSLLKSIAITFLWACLFYISYVPAAFNVLLSKGIFSIQAHQFIVYVDIFFTILIINSRQKLSKYQTLVTLFPLWIQPFLVLVPIFNYYGQARFFPVFNAFGGGYVLTEMCKWFLIFASTIVIFGLSQNFFSEIGEKRLLKSRTFKGFH